MKQQALKGRDFGRKCSTHKKNSIESLAKSLANSVDK
jgi:hypothetical protein